MAEGWAKFEKVCLEVGAGELSQLLHYLKFTMTLTSTPTPMAPVKQEVKQEEEAMDVVDIKTEDKPIIEKLIHISQGGKLLSTGVVIVTLPLKGQKWAWIPTSEMCTQTRLCCAPSMHF